MIADNMSVQKLFSKLKLMEIFDSKNGKKDQKLAFFFWQFQLGKLQKFEKPYFCPFCGNF